MKLEDLLLRRAAANRDAETILEIFSSHLSALEEIRTKPWRVVECPVVPPRGIQLTTPIGSFHYIDGVFYSGGYYSYSDYSITCNPNFYADAV